MDRIAKEILKDVSLDKIEPAAQKPASPVDHWTQAVLLERVAYLKKLARHGAGEAGETLREYPQHRAILSYRNRDGEAEVHERFADLFVVVAGKTTLVTGGSIIGARTVAPGEIRGTAIEGGTRQTLRAGDVAHVPAGTPHQMLLSNDETVACLIMKVQEES